LEAFVEGYKVGSTDRWVEAERLRKLERRENKGCIARIRDDAATMISSFAMLETGPFALGVGVLGVIAVVALAIAFLRKKA
jgi:hypothetical protein